MYKIEWTKYLKNDRLRYSMSSEERKANQYDNRDDYESDFGRVVFSSASRRMHDKTQVFPLTTDDNIHSRLTHSIEVMNIGYSLGINLCRNQDFINLYGKEEANELAWKICAILKTASFIHDIGNPPFGHFGEESIKNYFKRLFKHIKNQDDKKNTCDDKIQSIISSRSYARFSEFLKNKDYISDFTEFDGNAQGFRLITKLQYLNDLFGLNLTSACLAAYLKYPNISQGNKNDSNIAKHKHGVFYSEKSYLEEIANSCNLKIGNDYKRHPLSFFVEAADSICYLVMDIEDSINKDWYTYYDVKNYFTENNGKIASFFEEVEAAAQKKEEKTGLKSYPRKLFVDFRVKIISHLVTIGVSNFIKNAELIDNGRYNNELIEDDPDKIAIALKNFCREKILCKREIEYLELTGNSVINGLFDIYITLMFHESKKFRNRARDMISKAILLPAIIEFNPNFDEKNLLNFDIDSLPIELRLRILVDFVSGMTDKFAVNHYRKLSGQQI